LYFIILKEGDDMLRKISIVLSLAAALGLGLAVAAPDSASAQSHPKKPHHTHHTVVHSSHGPHYVVGHSYGGHVYYGHRRHYWHGRWYAYGIGPCWINVGGIWFWNIAACP
jgi:hypothetical protein